MYAHRRYRRPRSRSEELARYERAERNLQKRLEPAGARQKGEVMYIGGGLLLIILIILLILLL